MTRGRLSGRLSSPYVRQLHATGADFMLSPYVPASWWDPAGARKMAKRLEASDLPPFFGWLFVTFTVDPEKFDSPQQAYEAGNERLRKSIFALRECGHPIDRWLWKLELHVSGWPHWHLALDCREFIANEEIESAWGYGFVKTRRIKKRRDFRYLFKYLCKDPGQLPDWILDYPRRIRVFQTSAGFRQNRKAAGPRREPAAEIIERPATLRQKIQLWDSLGTVRVRERLWQSFTVTVRGGYVEVFIRRVNEGARPMDAYHIPLTLETIATCLEPWKPNRRPRHPPQPALISETCRMALTRSRAV